MDALSDILAVGFAGNASAFAPGGASLTRGVASVDFGAWPGATDATLVVTGQAGILISSVVDARIAAIATADHSVDEHILAASLIDAIATDIVAGVGFTLRVIARHQMPEPLTPPGNNRILQTGAGAAANSFAQGVEGSIGGIDTSRWYGLTSIAWTWG